MKLSPDTTRYLVWSAVVALGALPAVVDRRLPRRWLFGCLLVVGIGAGLLLSAVSPFSFGGSSHYMEGVIISGGSALALAGYAVAFVAQTLSARTIKRRE